MSMINTQKTGNDKNIRGEIQFMFMDVMRLKVWLIVFGLVVITSVWGAIAPEQGSSYRVILLLVGAALTAYLIWNEHKKRISVTVKD